jgi:hypothetical protein
VVVDHAHVLGSCASCHDGTTATGKHPAHIASGDTCDDCHTTIAWTPAVFDHVGILPGTCSTCHDGGTAAGKHPQHVQTNSECDVCHTTVAWIPANFDHQGITGSCSVCHNGVQATGTPSGHFSSAQECDYCHTTDFWSPSIFVHSSADYPGDHRRNLACTDCHGGNSDTVTWPFAQYQPDCAACHAGDYKSGPHEDASVSELRDCAGSCHKPNPEHSVRDDGW